MPKLYDFSHLVPGRASQPAGRANDSGDLQKQIDDANRRADEADRRTQKAEEEIKKLQDESDGEAADDGDADSDSEEMARPAGSRIRAARMRARARCAAIVRPHLGGPQFALACQLAFSTDIDRETANDILLAAGPEHQRDAMTARQAADSIIRNYDAASPVRS